MNVDVEVFAEAELEVELTVSYLDRVHHVALALGQAAIRHARFQLGICVLVGQ